MARGGKRDGAGRRKGQVSQQTELRKQVAERALSQGISPLDVMLSAMRNAWDNGDHKEAAHFAKEAAPYVHPRLAAVEHSGDKENPVAFQVVSGVPRQDDEIHKANGHAGAH